MNVTTAAQVNVRLLLTLAVVIGGARLVGWAVSKVGQPTVHGEILAGILLGPSFLGVVSPGGLGYLFPAPIIGALRVLAQIGLVMFIFLIGLGLELRQLRGQGYRVVVISCASILMPVVLGAGLALWIYPRLGGGVDRVGFVQFLGAAMAITDVTAWCVLALVMAVAQARGLTDAGRTIALSLAFIIFTWALIGPLLGRMPRVPMWLAICFALVSAWITEQIGTHAIFGAFMAGAAMPRTAEVRDGIHQKLEHATIALLLPVFFIVVGLSARVDLLNNAYLWAITSLVIAVAVVGKWGGSMLAPGPPVRPGAMRRPSGSS